MEPCFIAWKKNFWYCPYSLGNKYCCIIQVLKEVLGLILMTAVEPTPATLFVSYVPPDNGQCLAQYWHNELTIVADL
jgi:hypothetical protein